MDNTQQKNYEETWDEFWEEIICDSDGRVNLKQVKKELSDYHFVLQQVSKVYDHITGGLLSKPNYYAKDVIEKAREQIEKEREFEREEMIHAIETMMERQVGEINRVTIPYREWESFKNEMLGQR